MKKPIKLNWRGGEYNFTPRFLDGSPDQYNRNSNIRAPIFGADTESVDLENRTENQCFTLASELGIHFKYLKNKSVGLFELLEFISVHYAANLEIEKQAFIYFHNLFYDWDMLTKFDPVLLEMTKIGQSPEQDIEIGLTESGYKVILEKSGLFMGSAPHFSIKMQRTKNKFFTLHFRDTMSFFPGSLSQVSKDLGLREKMERQDDLGQIDYRTAPDSNDKTYFEEYAKVDADNTRLIGEQIRALHLSAKMTKIRPSSPGYAIARLLQGMNKEQKIRTGVSDISIMQLCVDCYKGGRTGGYIHGPMRNINIYDINSSYPASFVSLPSFNPNMVYHRLVNPKVKEVLEILKENGNMFLRVSGKETDEKYPALITPVKGKLCPVFGRFKNVATTGHELYAGVQSGTLTITKIHEAVMLFDVDENPFLPFKEFAESAYERKKNTVKGSIPYLGAKIEINAAYGKLIESRNSLLLGASDQWVFLPYIPENEKVFSLYYYTKYVEIKQQNKTFSDVKVYDELTAEVYEVFGDGDAVDYKQKAFGDFSLSGRIYGRFAVPAAAALTTGISRARLLVAMKATGAIYWDTDSIFIPNKSAAEVAKDFEAVADWLPKNVRPVMLGDKLGDFDCEVENATGYLAGTKRYYFVLPHCPKCSGALDEKHYCLVCERYGIKAAAHGIPALPFKLLPEAIKNLATGKDFNYRSKPRPLKPKEGKTPENIGSFRIAPYVSSFRLDDRLTWTRTKNGWTGTVKEWELLREDSARNVNPRAEGERAYDNSKEWAADSKETPDYILSNEKDS